MGPKSERLAPSAREILLALGLALAVFAWPLRAGLFDPGRILLGVDTACAQLPWRAAPGGEGSVAAPELADQGMVFYPAYRFALREWGWDGPPLWNPLLYAGAPAVGNPQLGLLDPQVLLQVLAGRVLGLAAFDWSFALLIWLRLACAAAGAYALARRLGLGRAGAALAGIGFSTAGFTALWANHSLGHVAVFLPWVLFALEGLRGARPARAFAAASLLFAAAVYGGHPETAFNVGLCSGLWALALAREDRRLAALGLAALALGTLLAAPSLLPFFEYLRHSGALVARNLAHALAEPDWIALGACALAVGIVARWRELAARSASFRGTPAALLAGVLLAACGAALASRRELPAARLFFWPDAYGPGSAYRGPGQFLEHASAWVAAPVALLALASACSRPAGAAPALARRGLVLALGFGALFLALAAPGVTELYRAAPIVGLAATGRLALVSGLALALLAGEALERAPKYARLAAATALALLAALAQSHSLPAAPDAAELTRDKNDGVVEFTERPEGTVSGGEAISGWIHPNLPAEAAELAVERVGAPSGAAQILPVELARAPAGGAAPEGALSFRAPRLWLEHLEEGTWRFTLRIFGAGGERLGERIVTTAALERRPSPSPRTIVFWICAGVFALGLAPGVTTWALLGFAALQGLGFLSGVHPAVERTRAFPPTETERILARELQGRRYFADPGVLPANTGMVRGLACADGYDGLDPASFDGYRSAVLRPGVQPLVGFTPRNAVLDSAAFRLLGVGALALSAPLEAPGFELVAGPDPAAPERAECWIYRAQDPLPRAFCVPRTVPREVALADLARFDPRAVAFLEDGGAFESAAPFRTAQVREVLWGRDALELEVTLDGDGLLVVTEQHFPGWRAEVDGRERPLLRADSIFRAVALEAGAHRVVLRYRPASWTFGLLAAALGAAVLSASTWRLSRPRTGGARA